MKNILFIRFAFNYIYLIIIRLVLDIYLLIISSIYLYRKIIDISFLQKRDRFQLQHAAY